MRCLIPSLLLPLLAGSSVFAQTPVLRTVVDSASIDERVDFGPLTTSPLPGVFRSTTVSAAVVPPLAGLTLRSVEVSGEASGSGQLTISNGTARPWWVGGEHWNGADCYGGSGAWGPAYGNYDYSSLGGFTLAPGMSTTIDLVGSFGSWFGSYDESDWQWPSVLASPLLNADVGITTISWGGAPLVVSGHIEVSLNVTQAATIELSETPMIRTCTSPANSTGATAQLAAFGSLKGGENWLSIRATGVPAGQFGLMFVGTQPGLFVWPTYNICLGGSLVRMGGVQMSSASGDLDFEFDLFGWQAGDTAYCQVVHRDPVLGISASDASVITIE